VILGHNVGLKFDNTLRHPHLNNTIASRVDKSKFIVNARPYETREVHFLKKSEKWAFTIAFNAL